MEMIEQLFVLKNLREVRFDYDFSNDVTIPCRIKSGWDKEGKLGQYFGNMIINEMSWSIVLFHGDEDPSFHKTAGLEFLTMKWLSK
jgi:hypothetical protein